MSGLQELPVEARWWKGRVAQALLLALICLLALALRVDLRYDERYIFFGNPRTGYPSSDAITFNVHALNLVAGRGFGDYLKQFRSLNYVPPGHPLVLGFFYFFLGMKPAAVGWGMAILGSLLPLLAYLWTREMWGRGVGLIAALLVAIHSSYVRIGFSLMSETSALFTTALALWLGARLMRRPTGWSVAAAGLAFGFASLVRPGALAFIWGVVACLLVGLPLPFRRRLAVAAAFLAVSFAPAGVWEARNWAVHGKPAAVYTSISARHAWTGAKTPYAPSFYSRTAWHETLWSHPEESELEMIERLGAETKQLIRADWVRWFFGALWRMHVLGNLESASDRDEIIAWDFGGRTFAQTLALFLLGLAGLLRALRVRTRVEEGGRSFEIPGGAWCLLVGVGVLLAVAGTGLYGATERYRWPLDYALFPMAALAIYSLARMSKVDLASRWVLPVRVEPPHPWVRRLTQGVAAAVAGLVLVYAAGLGWAHTYPEDPVAQAPSLTVTQVEEAIRASGLWDDFSRQEPRWVTYDEVFEEQARNYGKVVSYNDRVVAWWGRLLLAGYRGDGRLRNGYVVLSPRKGDFGGVRLELESWKKAEFGLAGLREGDIVTLIARIRQKNGPIRRPDLYVFGAVPGRFDPPARGELR